MLHCGLTRAKATEISGWSRSTVQRSVTAYRTGGLDQLRRWGVRGPVSDLVAHTTAIRETLTTRPVRTATEVPRCPVENPLQQPTPPTRCPQHGLLGAQGRLEAVLPILTTHRRDQIARTEQHGGNHPHRVTVRQQEQHMGPTLHPMIPSPINPVQSRLAFLGWKSDHAIHGLLQVGLCGNTLLVQAIFFRKTSRPALRLVLGAF